MALAINRIIAQRVAKELIVARQETLGSDPMVREIRRRMVPLEIKRDLLRDLSARLEGESSSELSQRGARLAHELNGFVSRLNYLGIQVHRNEISGLNARAELALIKAAIKEGSALTEANTLLKLPLNWRAPVARSYHQKLERGQKMIARKSGAIYFSLRGQRLPTSEVGGGQSAFDLLKSFYQKIASIALDLEQGKISVGAASKEVRLQAGTPGLSGAIRLARSLPTP